jgi:hypothetical protein
MTNAIPIIFLAVAFIAFVVLSRYLGRRERRWRREQLKNRPELSDSELAALYRISDVNDERTIRILRSVSEILHVPTGLLRPEDSIISLQAPRRPICDDLWDLDNSLLEARLIDKELAAQTRTIGDIVRLVARAEAKKGREVV